MRPTFKPGQEVILIDRTLRIVERKLSKNLYRVYSYSHGTKFIVHSNEIELYKEVAHEDCSDNFN